jgi:hypothetical protein
MRRLGSERWGLLSAECTARAFRRETQYVCYCSVEDDEKGR